jgi:predicted PhzF superfamily epimerase YddE/YHI9
VTRPVFCVDAFTAEPFAGGPGGHDFVSRFFAPGAGIDEDPVTGSAHCTLGPFWAERLGRAVTVLRGQLV